MQGYPWWNENHNKLSKQVREYVDGILDYEQALRLTRDFPWRVVKEVGQKGWLGAAIPRRYGGSWEDLGSTGLCILNEEFGRAFYSTRFYGLSVYGGVWQIVRKGNEEQRVKWLPRMAKGEIIGAITMTEPFTGSDAAEMQTTARKERDCYVINGKKRFISGAGSAHLYLVYCRTSDKSEDRESYQHLSAFLVERATPGFTVERINEVMGGVAYRNGNLDFDNVCVPRENMLGKEGDGWRIMVDGLNIERIMVAASGIGAMRQALRYSYGYGRRRIVWKKPLIEQQAVQLKIADIICSLETARLYTYYSALLLDRGDHVAMQSAVAKVYSSEKQLQAVMDAMQCMGGDGTMMMYPLEKLVASAKISNVGGGSNEILRELIVREARKTLADDLGEVHGLLPSYARAHHVKLPEDGSIEDSVLRALAVDYLVNPGLYSEIEDLAAKLSLDPLEFEKLLPPLEEEGLVSLYRDKHHQVRLVKATYSGLKRAVPKEFYKMIPDYVKEKNELF
jgi:alkylation response protein AidB-like acyl-CoA dehydrogenase